MLRQSQVEGGLPDSFRPDLIPPLSNRLPLVQTIRIVEPSNYARTVFIEALVAAGIKLDTAAVRPPRPIWRAGGE